MDSSPIKDFNRNLNFSGQESSFSKILSSNSSTAASSNTELDNYSYREQLAIHFENVNVFYSF